MVRDDDLIKSGNERERGGTKQTPSSYCQMIVSDIICFSIQSKKTNTYVVKKPVQEEITEQWGCKLRNQLQTMSY